MPKDATVEERLDYLARANWKASAAQTVNCPNCGAPALPHMACPSCGSFRGRVYREAIRAPHAK